MHRTHSGGPRFDGFGPTLVSFHKQHGIGDGRGGPRAYKPSAPAPTPPPEDPTDRLKRFVLVVVLIAAAAAAFTLWILFCAGSFDVGAFGSGR